MPSIHYIFQNKRQYHIWYHTQVLTDQGTVRYQGAIYATIYSVTTLDFMQQLILANAGTQTRRAFIAGAGDTPVLTIKTKSMIMLLGYNEPISFVYKGEIVDFTDSVVFTRLRANDALFCGILYEHLEALGIPASDPINRAYPNAEEKIAQMARFVRAGIPIPKTIIAREEGYAANRDYILEHVSFPLVYKLDGSQGNRVHKINSAEELDAHIALKPKHERFILQELIPNTFDTRTLVAYGTILGSIKRVGQPGSFLNNVSKGADVLEHHLTDEEKAVAIAATKATNIDFGGVDMIATETGFVVIEVNKSPQVAGFERVFGKGYVFSKIAALLKERYA